MYGKKRNQNIGKRTAPGEQSVDMDSLSEYQLVLFQGSRDMIDREVLVVIHELLDAFIDTERSQTSIDLWVDSPGGDAHAAFKLYRELRDKCTRLRVAVPDYAKSAATLFAIGADELFLSASADLGPLDAQIEHPDREGRTVSALAGANALEHIMRLGTSLTMATGPHIVSMTGLPRTEVLRELFEFSANALAPVLEKLDPQLIHEAAESLKVTRKYAQLVIQARQENKFSDRQARDVAASLVSDYPTHGYVIDRCELEKLGFPSTMIAEHQFWPYMKLLHKSFTQKAEESIIRLIPNDKMPESNNDN